MALKQTSKHLKICLKLCCWVAWLWILLFKLFYYLKNKNQICQKPQEERLVLNSFYKSHNINKTIYIVCILIWTYVSLTQNSTSYTYRHSLILIYKEYLYPGDWTACDKKHSNTNIGLYLWGRNWMILRLSVKLQKCRNFLGFY